MTDFREILRLNSLGLSNADVAEAVSCSRNTVSKVLKACSFFPDTERTHREHRKNAEKKVIADFYGHSR